MAFVAAFAGCQGDDKIDVPGLVDPIRAATSLTVDEAVASPLALSSYLRTTPLEVRPLGPFTATMQTTIATSPQTDGSEEQLTNEITLRVADSGDFHAADTNSAGLGREVISLGSQLYLRPQHAKWHERAAQAGEADNLRTTWLRGFAEHLEPVTAGLAIANVATTEYQGRAARRVQFGKAPTSKATAESISQRKWRESITVQAVSGFVVLDHATGVVLEGELDASLQFLRAGKPVSMRITAKQHVVFGAVELAAPAANERVATPQRIREVDDAKALLNGL